MASTESTNPSYPIQVQPSQFVLNSNNDSTTPNPLNPYFLNSSENSGNILVTQPLLGMKNYQSWSRAMILALIVKKKIGFVNGKISKPDLDSPLYEDWESCNTMVFSWMINSMHVDVSSSIITVKQLGRCGLNCKIFFDKAIVPRFTIYREKFLIFLKIKCQ